MTRKSKFLMRSILFPAAIFCALSLSMSAVLAQTAQQFVDRTLLVMPYASDEDTTDLIKEVNGDIVEAIGTGQMTVWVVRFKDQRKLIAAEKRLCKDKQLKSVERDAVFTSQTAVVPNDPYFPQEWHLQALKVPEAWGVHSGGNVPIVVLDKGVSSSNPDLSGRVYKGYNASTGTSGNFSNLHGTLMATTMAAAAGNGKLTAGPAKLSSIMPVVASTGTFTSSNLIKSFDYIGNKTSVKLVNLSLNNAPPNSFGNASKYQALHSYLKWYHDKKGGLIFNAGGNQGVEDPAKMNSYLIVVQAVDESLKRAYFSNWGNSTWFTAPGVNVWCSNDKGQATAAHGTSMSSPLVCSIAAMIWAAKPSLTNVQVENALKNSCQQLDGNPVGWNKTYGWGMPDAEKALNSLK